MPPETRSTDDRVAGPRHCLSGVPARAHRTSLGGAVDARNGPAIHRRWFHAASGRAAVENGPPPLRWESAPQDPNGYAAATSHRRHERLGGLCGPSNPVPESHRSQPMRPFLPEAPTRVCAPSMRSTESMSIRRTRPRQAWPPVFQYPCGSRRVARPTTASSAACADRLPA